MDEVTKNISEDAKLTREDFMESAMKCAEVGCFGIGKDMDEDELRRILKKEEKQTLFSIPIDEQEWTDSSNLAKSIENESRKILREFLKDHPDCLYGSREEWVRRMTPEQKKEYELSLAQKAAMEMVSPMIGMKEIEKLGDEINLEKISHGRD